MQPLPITVEDQPALLALNNRFVTELSPLDAPRLAHLLRQACYACRIGPAGAFLIAVDEHADYDSPNYRWFRARYNRFIYIDRVVVAPDCRGQGLARRLYADLFAHAAEADHTLIVCEVNSDPPNPASDAFHAALGFTQVGAATIAGGTKTVRYLSRAV